MSDNAPLLLPFVRRGRACHASTCTDATPAPVLLRPERRSVSRREGRVHRAQLSQCEREIRVRAGQRRQPPDSCCRLLAPIVTKGSVRDVQFSRSGDPDRVDHRDRAVVLKDVRRLEIAVQCNSRSALPLFEQLSSERLQRRHLRDGGIDARTPISESLPAGARGPVQRAEEQR